MPKGNTGTDDRAKVKVRVIEFELEGGNSTVENSIRQLTTALTSRPVLARPLAPKHPKELGAANDGPEVEEPEVEIIEPETTETNGDAVQPKKSGRSKSKPKPPTYIHNLLAPEQFSAFKEFAKEKNPSSRRMQYLVASYWLKEHGDNDTVNADKIYTCYKTAEWPTGFNDWRATFDNLVHVELMRKTGTAEFAINPTGEQEVKKGTST